MADRGTTKTHETTLMETEELQKHMKLHQRFLIYEDGRSLIGATRGEIDYKSYKGTPKWALASDPNLVNSHIYSLSPNAIPQEYVAGKEKCR